MEEKFWRSVVAYAVRRGWARFQFKKTLHEERLLAEFPEDHVVAVPPRMAVESQWQALQTAMRSGSDWQ